MVILCTIDLETREVSLPAGQVIASYDHNVDVIRFQAEAIPGFSLNTSSIKIAAQGPNNVRHDYAVDPSTVSIEEETGYITFDWPIPAGVTEMPIGAGFKYGDKGQLIFAVCAEIISGSTLSKAWHSDDGIITVVAHLEPESGGGEDPEEEATNAQKIAQLQTDVAVINTQVDALGNGSPKPARTVAEMTEHDKVYLYTGSETDYTAGNWYFWNGSAWTSGGQYGGAVTDTTLSISGRPADAKAVGDALALKADSSDVTALDTRVTALENGGAIEEIEALVDSGKTQITPDITWITAWVDTSGVIQTASASKTGLVTMHAGETVTVGTRNRNICIIGSTESDSIAVGDTVTVIQTTSTVDRYETYKYTAEADINIVICVKTSPYDLSFEKTTTLARQVDEISDSTQKGVAAVVGTTRLGSAISEWDNYNVLAGSGDGHIGTTGMKYHANNQRLSTRLIDVSSRTSNSLAINITSGYRYFLVGFDADLTRKTFSVDWTTTSGTLTLTDDTTYIVIVLSTTSSARIWNWESQYITVQIGMIGGRIDAVEAQAQTVVNALDNLTNDIVAITTFEVGSLNADGTEKSATNRLRSGFIKVANLGKIHFIIEEGYKYEVDTYDASMTSHTSYDWRTLNSEMQFSDIDPEIDTIRILIAKSDDSTITLDESSNLKGIYCGWPAESGIYDVPAYFAENLETAISTAESNMDAVGRDGETFVFFSDPHWSNNDKHSPGLIKRIVEELPINVVICGGDMITGSRNVPDMVNSMESCIEVFSSLPVRFYTTIGNHDDNRHSSSAATTWSKAKTYNLMQKQFDLETSGSGPECTYYVDIPATKTRVIVLDSEAPTSAIRASEVTWLTEVLASAPDGWHAMIFLHIMYSWNTWHTGMTSDELFRTELGNAICNACDTHNASGTGATVEAIFCGHTHFDAEFTSTAGIPIIIIDCDARSTGTVVDGVVDYTKGTITEQCLDIVTMDYTNKVIKCVRVGRGSSREISYASAES